MTKDRLTQVKTKVWLTRPAGGGFLGEGRCRLLEEIDRCQSLQEASRKLGMSYRKAWGDIRAIETALGFEVVHRTRGGAGGGASYLTERGKRLLAAYQTLKDAVEAAARKAYRQTVRQVIQP